MPEAPTPTEGVPFAAVMLVGRGVEAEAESVAVTSIGVCSEWGGSRAWKMARRASRSGNGTRIWEGGMDGGGGEGYGKAKEERGTRILVLMAKGRVDGET